MDSQSITRAVVYAIERTESRKALLKAEERYRGIFENSVAGIFQTSPEGTYLDVNPALTRIYGYASREEMMSKISDIARLLYVDPNRRTEFIRLMREKDVVQDFEAQIYRKDGSIIWISENARAVKDAQGNILFYEGMVEDITARKEAEEKLRFSELRFRSIWQKSFEGMRLTDEQGIMLAVNPAYCQIVGLPAEELVGRPYTDIYSPSENVVDMMQKYRKRFAEKKDRNTAGTPCLLPLRQDRGYRTFQFLYRDGGRQIDAPEPGARRYRAQASRGARAQGQRRTGPKPG
jgi:PAS domain S-box-containing protein